MLTSAAIQSRLKRLLMQAVNQSSVLNTLSKSYGLKLIHVDRSARQIILSQHEIEEGKFKREQLPDTLLGLTDPQIIYSSYVKSGLAKLEPKTLHKIGESLKLQEKLKVKKNAIPLIVEKNIVKPEKDYIVRDGQSEIEAHIFYPYAHTEQINNIPESGLECSDSENFLKPKLDVQDEIALRMGAYEEGILEQLDAPKGNLVEDQDTYDFNADSLADENSMLQLLIEEQGSADPNYPVSNVPCGGCGAFLHCQQPSLIGEYSVE